VQDRDIHDADQVRERIGEILKSALAPAEDIPLEDETRRLMLHLSCEPIEGPVRQVAAVPTPRRPRLIERVLGKKVQAGA
jgi:hypothetical protein